MLRSANNAWILMLTDVTRDGMISSPRGIESGELLNHSTLSSIKAPVVTHPGRKLNASFLFGEAWWILSGQNRVSTIAKYMKAITRFSDDGLTFSGAYGPMVVDQLRYVCDSLLKDWSTRQAVMTVWRPNPRDSKDIPCTVSIQFFIRDGRLHVIDNMRSSDCWLGWPYDVFNFSMLAAYVALMLRHRGLAVDLGGIFMNAGSRHIYSSDYAKVDEALNHTGMVTPSPELSLSEFSSPDDFLQQLEVAPFCDVESKFFTQIKEVLDWKK